MGAKASQTTSLTIVYSSVYSGEDRRKHQSSASLAFVRGIHRWPVNSLHKWPVTLKMFLFDDVIMHQMTEYITGLWNRIILVSFSSNQVLHFLWIERMCCRAQVLTSKHSRAQVLTLTQNRNWKVISAKSISLTCITNHHVLWDGMSGLLIHPL